MSDETKGMHSVILENRKKLALSGVKDVISFDDCAVVMQTVLGRLTVKGDSLHISGFNRETGDLQMDGLISIFGYSDTEKGSASLFGRIFK